MSDDSWHWEKDHGFDAEGHQRKEACLGFTVCPVCGGDVELVADTEEWTQDDNGRWIHSSYGPAQGVCCNHLIASWWDGTFVYKLSEPL